MSNAVLWWDQGAIDAARVQKAALQAEIEGLQANRESWVKAGVLQRVITCGPKRRFCVKIDQSAGEFGEQGEYRVIQGH